MDIVELKKHIEQKDLSDQFLILQYSDTTFLAQQYIRAIAEFKGLEIHYVDDFEEVASSIPTYLNVAFLDTYTNLMYCDYLSNLIVVCKKVESGGEPFAVKLPKLEDWQIEDYVTSQLPGLEAQYVHWLCINAQYDIDRLQQEVDKLKIFPKGSQQVIMLELSGGEGYVDLHTLTAFQLVEAVTHKDLDTIAEYFTEQVDFNVLGLIGLLIRNFQQILNVQINPRSTPESLGMNYKQYKAVQSSCGFYSNEQLIEIYDFLVNLDRRIKLGQLEVSNLKDYVIPHILTT